MIGGTDGRTRSLVLICGARRIWGSEEQGLVQLNPNVVSSRCVGGRLYTAIDGLSGGWSENTEPTNQPNSSCFTGLGDLSNILFLSW